MSSKKPESQSACTSLGEVLDLEEVARLLAQVREDVVARRRGGCRRCRCDDGQALGLLGGASAAGRRWARSAAAAAAARCVAAAPPSGLPLAPAAGSRVGPVRGHWRMRRRAPVAAGEWSSAIRGGEGRRAGIGARGHRRPHEEEHQKHSGQDGEQASGSHRGRARATFVGQRAKARSLVAHAEAQVNRADVRGGPRTTRTPRGRRWRGTANMATCTGRIGGEADERGGPEVAQGVDREDRQGHRARAQSSVGALRSRATLIGALRRKRAISQERRAGRTGRRAGGDGDRRRAGPERRPRADRTVAARDASIRADRAARPSPPGARRARSADRPAAAQDRARRPRGHEVTRPNMTVALPGRRPYCRCRNDGSPVPEAAESERVRRSSRARPAVEGHSGVRAPSRACRDRQVRVAAAASPRRGPGSTMRRHSSAMARPGPPATKNAARQPCVVSTTPPIR